LLAQQLFASVAVKTAWPRKWMPVSRSELLALQTALNARGFDSGAPDGAMGPAAPFASSSAA